MELRSTAMLGVPAPMKSLGDLNDWGGGPLSEPCVCSWSCPPPPIRIGLNQNDAEERRNSQTHTNKFIIF